MRDIKYSGQRKDGTDATFILSTAYDSLGNTLKPNANGSLEQVTVYRGKIKDVQRNRVLGNFSVYNGNFRTEQRASHSVAPLGSRSFDLRFINFVIRKKVDKNESDDIW